MQLQINGKTENTSAVNLAELVKDLGLPESSLVVEHNGQIIRQEQWMFTILHEEDVVELLSFVGGG